MTPSIITTTTKILIIIIINKYNKYKNRYLNPPMVFLQGVILPQQLRKQINTEFRVIKAIETRMPGKHKNPASV